MNLVRQPSCNSMRTRFASGDLPQSPKQPSERRFDEAALSRMDDEKGIALRRRRVLIVGQTSTIQASTGWARTELRRSKASLTDAAAAVLSSCVGVEI
jgi:hypothetical protein